MHSVKFVLLFGIVVVVSINILELISKLKERLIVLKYFKRIFFGEIFVLYCILSRESIFFENIFNGLLFLR